MLKLEKPFHLAGLSYNNLIVRLDKEQPIKDLTWTLSSACFYRQFAFLVWYGFPGFVSSYSCRLMCISRRAWSHFSFMLEPIWLICQSHGIMAAAVSLFYHSSLFPYSVAGIWSRASKVLPGIGKGGERESSKLAIWIFRRNIEHKSDGTRFPWPSPWNRAVWLANSRVDGAGSSGASGGP